MMLTRRRGLALGLAGFTGLALLAMALQAQRTHNSLLLSSTAVVPCAALRASRVGRTTAYSALATTSGQPGAARAVATANATNPVAIVIPCHRVIHADGTLSGYGGGVDRKRWLLRHEGALLF